MHILSLSGSALDRGRAHGETLREEIREQLDWFRSLIKGRAGVSAGGLFLGPDCRGWIEAIEKWTPWLLEEVRGIAEGAHQPYLDLLSWNLCQEVFWAVYIEHSILPPGESLSGCSALGDIGDSQHPTLLAQNADTVSFWHNHQVLLRFREPGRDVEQIMLSFPGMIGVYGLNSRGVGLCVNALFYKLQNSMQGLGTPFMARGILSQPDYQAAEAFLKAAPHASANALTLGGPGHVTAFEVSANQIRSFHSPSQPCRTYHTNHELVNDDLRPGIDPTPWPNSVERLQILADGLERVKEPLTVRDIQVILSTHAERAQICRHADDPDGSMTTYSMIMECSDRPELHVAFGPPCLESYQTFGF